MRRPDLPFDCRRFIGNADPEHMKVQDLDLEDESESGCQIDEIQSVKTFVPDELDQAHKERYIDCEKYRGKKKSEEITIEDNKEIEIINEKG